MNISFSDTALVISCHLAKESKFSSLKQQMFLLSVFLGQEFCFIGWSCSASQEVVVKMSVGVTVIWRLECGCWQEAAVPRWLNFILWASPGGCWSVFTKWQLASPREEWSKQRGRRKEYYILWPCRWDHTLPRPLGLPATTQNTQWNSNFR